MVSSTSPRERMLQADRPLSRSYPIISPFGVYGERDFPGSKLRRLHAPEINGQRARRPFPCGRRPCLGAWLAERVGAGAFLPPDARQGVPEQPQKTRLL